LIRLAERARLARAMSPADVRFSERGPALGGSAPAFRLVGARQSYAVALGFKRAEVLHGIDLELASGARLALVGPNGSGKSTLLRMLAGIERPRGGAVEVLGGEPTDEAVRRRIGYLPEDSPFPRELRALDALVLLATLRRTPKPRARERAAELLERVGLAAQTRTPLGRFSRGMLRRFGLAQALVHEPELVLLDEPTAGLDAMGFLVFEELLGEARARGASIAIASHLLSDVQARCDQIAVLLDGRVAAHGAPGEVFANPPRVQLVVEGLAPEALSEVESEIVARGGRIAARPPLAEGLLELYRRLSP
jgi:ABC-2 type transport system ATP-binding protein